MADLDDILRRIKELEANLNLLRSHQNTHPNTKQAAPTAWTQERIERLIILLEDGVRILRTIAVRIAGEYDRSELPSNGNNHGTRQGHRGGGEGDSAEVSGSEAEPGDGGRGEDFDLSDIARERNSAGHYPQRNDHRSRDNFGDDEETEPDRSRKTGPANGMGRDSNHQDDDVEED